MRTAKYTVTVREVEELTGFDFFAALEDAEEVELETRKRSLPRQ